MKTSFKKEPGSVVVADITLSGEEFYEYWKRIHDDALGNVSLKGFRKGAAPEELAEKAIDKDAVFHGAVEAAAKATLREVAEENQWTFIDTPQIEVQEAKAKNATDATKKPGLRYTAKLTIFPEVKLGDYKKIAQAALKEKKEVVISDEDVEKSLSWIRESRAKLIRKDGVAESGDVVEADITSAIEGKAIEGGELKGDRFVIGQSRFVPGFDEKLVGRAADETTMFSLTAPGDYWQKDLQNKEIEFTVSIKGVFTRELPELNDEFASSLGPQIENVDALKKTIREGLTFEQEGKEKERIRGKILEALIDASKVDLPDIMVEKTLESLIEETRALLQGTPNKPVDDETLKKTLKEKAERRVLGHLVINAIGNKESLNPTEEEVKEVATSQNLDPEKYYDYSYGIVQHKKIFEFLEKE